MPYVQIHIGIKKGKVIGANVKVLLWFLPLLKNNFIIGTSFKAMNNVAIEI
jgi:hypothetical protein